MARRNVHYDKLRQVLRPLLVRHLHRRNRCATGSHYAKALYIYAPDKRYNTKNTNVGCFEEMIQGSGQKNRPPDCLVHPQNLRYNTKHVIRSYYLRWIVLIKSHAKKRNTNMLNRHTTRMKMRGNVVRLFVISFIFRHPREGKRKQQKKETNEGTCGMALCIPWYQLIEDRMESRGIK